MVTVNINLLLYDLDRRYVDSELIGGRLKIKFTENAFTDWVSFQQLSQPSVGDLCWVILGRRPTNKGGSPWKMRMKPIMTSFGWPINSQEKIKKELIDSWLVSIFQVNLYSLVVCYLFYFIIFFDLRSPVLLLNWMKRTGEDDEL